MARIAARTARAAGPTPTVTAAVAAELRRLTARGRTVDNGNGGQFIPPWPAMLEQLESGGTITLPGWKITAACQRAGITPPALTASQRYDISGHPIAPRGHPSPPLGA